MRRLFAPIAAVWFFSASLLAQRQSTEDALHAPDGNTREMIQSILIPAVTNVPFQAILTAGWTKHLQDGSTMVVGNHRLVVRDSQGRIYQERRTLVPEGGSQESVVFRIEISNPVTHTKYFCDPALTQCEPRNYDPPLIEAALPVGPLGDGTRYLSRASLGTRNIEGMEAIGTRETITVQAGAIGNSAPVDSTKEFWYSPKLGLNLQVLRIDPLHGDQQFSITNLKLSEPDPRLFVLPQSCKIVDMRAARDVQGSSSASVH